MAEARKFYLETSAWSRLVDRADPERRRATRRFLEWLRPRRFILVSDLIRAELRETRDPQILKQVVRKFVRSPKRIVPTTARVRTMAWELIEAGCTTENHLADALHLAYSIAGGAYALVTWDVQDLARDHTRRLLRDYCWRRGIPEMRIGTPVEVGRWLDVRIV